MIIFVRHGHTTYSEIYPDLTDEGIQSVIETAEKIKQIIENKNPKSVKVVCSPAPRAQGTADIIINTLKISTKRIDDPFLSAIQFYNQEQALSFLEATKAKGIKVEDIYEKAPIFDNENIFEPKIQIKKRFNKFLKKTIETYNADSCVIVVSHYEVLKHLCTLNLAQFFTLDPHKKELDYDGLTTKLISLPGT